MHDESRVEAKGSPSVTASRGTGHEHRWHKEAQITLSLDRGAVQKSHEEKRRRLLARTGQFRIGNVKVVQNY